MSAAERREFFKQVALVQLQTRTAGVLKGAVEGTVMCPLFLKDVALITEGLLKAAEDFSLNADGGVRAVTKEVVEQICKTHQELISKLYDNSPDVTSKEPEANEQK